MPMRPHSVLSSREADREPAWASSGSSFQGSPGPQQGRHRPCDLLEPIIDFFASRWLQSACWPNCSTVKLSLLLDSVGLPTRLITGSSEGQRPYDTGAPGSDSETWDSIVYFQLPIIPLLKSKKDRVAFSVLFQR